MRIGKLCQLLLYILSLFAYHKGKVNFIRCSKRVLVYLSSLTLVVGCVLYYLFLFYSSPIPFTLFAILNLTFHGVLLLFITLICLPPLIPKLHEKNSIKSFHTWSRPIKLILKSKPKLRALWQRVLVDFTYDFFLCVFFYACTLIAYSFTVVHLLLW